MRNVFSYAYRADGSEDIAIGDAYAPDPNVTSKLAVQFAAGKKNEPSTDNTRIMSVFLKKKFAFLFLYTTENKFGKQLQYGMK